MKLFVYGTLKRGHGNNFLLRNSEFLGEALTEADYDIFSAGIPFLTEGEYAVRGDLYEVDDQTRRTTDALEGHPGFYTRAPLQIQGFTDVQAYMVLREDLEARGIEPCPVLPDGTKQWDRD